MRNRMLASRFDSSRNRQKLKLAPPAKRDQFDHFGASKRERACLVHGDRSEMSRRFEINAAFDQNALTGRPGQSRDDADGSRDHPGAGAGNDKKHQRLIEPRRPTFTEQERRTEEDRTRAEKGSV